MAFPGCQASLDLIGSKARTKRVGDMDKRSKSKIEESHLLDDPNHRTSSAQPPQQQRHPQRHQYRLQAQPQAGVGPGVGMHLQGPRRADAMR